MRNLISKLVGMGSPSPNLDLEAGVFFDGIGDHFAQATVLFGAYLNSFIAMNRTYSGWHTVDADLGAGQIDTIFSAIDPLKRSGVGLNRGLRLRLIKIGGGPVNLVWEVRDGNTNVRQIQIDIDLTVIELGVPFHWAVTYQGNPGVGGKPVTKLYINGLLVSTILQLNSLVISIDNITLTNVNNTGFILGAEWFDETTASVLSFLRGKAYEFKCHTEEFDDATAWGEYNDGMIKSGNQLPTIIAHWFFRGGMMAIGPFSVLRSEPDSPSFFSENGLVATPLLVPIGGIKSGDDHNVPPRLY